MQASSIQPAVNRLTPKKKRVVLTFLALSLTLSGGALQAGVLEPLLQIMRPKQDVPLSELFQRLRP